MYEHNFVHFLQESSDNYNPPSNAARALILSLSVCYHARLRNRNDYEIGVVEEFTGPIYLSGKQEQFLYEIRWYVSAVCT